MRFILRFRDYRIFFGLALLFNLLLAACSPLEEGTPTSVPSPTPNDGFKGKIIVGGVFDLSGASSVEGREYAAGVSSYVNYYNSKGGANNFKLDLRATDFAAKAPVAIEQYQKLLKEGAVAFISWDTADTLALSRQIKNDHVPLLSASYDEELVRDPKQQPYTFMIAPSYTDQLKLALLYARKIRYDQARLNEPLQVAYLYSDDDFGRFPFQAGRDFASQSKGFLWFHEGVLQPKLDRENLAKEVNRLRIARPEFTFVQAKPDVVTELLKLTKATSVPTALIGLNYTATPDLPQQAGKAAENFTAVAVQAFPDEASPGLDEIKRYLAERRSISNLTPTTEPNLIPANPTLSLRFIQGWDTMKVLAEGIRQAIISDASGSLSGDKIREGLESIRQLDMGGLTPPLSFGPNQHKGTDTARFIRVENGKWKTIGPPLSLAELDYQNSLPTPTPPPSPTAVPVTTVKR